MATGNRRFRSRGRIRLKIHDASGCFPDPAYPLQAFWPEEVRQHSERESACEGVGAIALTEVDRPCDP